MSRTLQQALDALDAITDDVDGTGLNTMPSFDKALDAIAALREALNAPEPEPVARCILDNGDEMGSVEWLVRPRSIRLDHGSLLYAAPPAAPASQWMPIETAPKDGSELLLSNGEAVSQGHWLHAEAYTREKRDADGHYIDQDEFDGFDGWIDYTGGMQPEPTHWMPLPAAPDHLHDIAEKVGPAAPVPDGMETNADEVICPNCAHQFRAIPGNVQSLLLASGHEPPFTAPPAAPVVPLPRPGPLGLIQYAGSDMQEYAAAVSTTKDAEIAQLRAELIKSLADSAALRERVKLLEDALRHVDDCLSINDYDDYVLLSRFDSDIVSAALAARKGEATTPPPSPSPRS